MNRTGIDSCPKRIIVFYQSFDFTKLDDNCEMIIYNADTHVLFYAELHDIFTDDWSPNGDSSLRETDESQSI